MDTNNHGLPIRQCGWIIDLLGRGGRVTDGFDLKERCLLKPMNQYGVDFLDLAKCTDIWIWVEIGCSKLLGFEVRWCLQVTIDNQIFYAADKSPGQIRELARWMIGCKQEAERSGVEVENQVSRLSGVLVLTEFVPLWIWFTNMKCSLGLHMKEVARWLLHSSDRDFKWGSYKGDSCSNNRKSVCTSCEQQRICKLLDLS